MVPATEESKTNVDRNRDAISDKINCKSFSLSLQRNSLLYIHVKLLPTVFFQIPKKVAQFRFKRCP